MNVKHIIIAIGIVIILLASGFAVYAFSSQNDSGISVPATDVSIYPANDHEQAQHEINMALELKEEILLLDYIQDCLVLIKTSADSPLVLSSDGFPAVSTVLTTKDNEMLSPPEVQSVTELIRKIIPDISDDNITITDSNLNYYLISDQH